MLTQAVPSALPSPTSSLFALSSLHYWATAILCILLLPLSGLAHVSFGLPSGLVQLFIVFGFKAIILAAILHVIATPFGSTVTRFRAQPSRLLMLAVLPAVFVAIVGWSTGLTLGLGASIIVEFLHQTSTGRFRRIASCLVPGLYLLLGITLIWDYNDIIVSFRFFGAYDPLFMRIDSWLGIDVPAISKQAVVLFSPRLLVWAEQIYYGMFTVLGAALVLIGLQGGLRRAMQFVGAALLAYYVALVCFVAFPSLGPFYLCSDHAASFPATLDTYSFQTAMLSHASAMWRHEVTVAAPGGYFIAFPCMHVVKPTLACWYLRHHKRAAFLLLAYLLILPIAIILLEWHYFIDILAGFAISAVVIGISDHEFVFERMKKYRATASEGTDYCRQ